MTKSEIEKLARDIGNLQVNIGFSSPRDVKNAGLYFGALLALQTVFPEPESVEELIERRKKEFANKLAIEKLNE